MRIGPVLLGTALVLSLTATRAAGQGTSAPGFFVGGLGGLTFGTATSSAVAGQVGVRISRDLFVIGEIGRIQDVVPSELSDLLDELEEEAELGGVPVEFDVKVPAFYGFGGIRWAQSGRRIAPFAEGGAGFARLTGKIRAVVGGVDITDFIEDEIGDVTGLSTTEFLIAFGGGVNIGLTPAVSLDAGYRFTKIFTENPPVSSPFSDDPAVNTSMVYAAIKILLGR